MHALTDAARCDLSASNFLRGYLFKLIDGDEAKAELACSMCSISADA